MIATGILLVEDDEHDALLTRRALARTSAEIVRARDGVEALALLHASDPTVRVTPRVVLLDLKLPKVDGFEVLRRVRADERTRLLPVVVLTSSSEDRDVDACYGLGANSYVAKPIEFQRFADAVGMLGLYWLDTNAPPPRGHA